MAILTLGSTAPMAQAAETVKLKVEFSPNRLGGNTTLRIATKISGANGGLPSPVISFNMALPPNLELIGSTLGLAICQPDALTARGLEGCSPNAQLGTGTAIVAVPFGPEVVSEAASIRPLMGPPVGEQIGVLMYVESRTPVSAQLVFPGLLLIGSEAESENLKTSFPPTPTLPGAPDAAVTELHLNVGPEHLTYYRQAHGRRVGYQPKGIALPVKCPRGGFQFVASMSFEDGSTVVTPYTVPCSSRRHG